MYKVLKPLTSGLFVVGLALGAVACSSDDATTDDTTEDTTADDTTDSTTEDTTAVDE